MRPSRPSGATIAADLPVSALLFQAQTLIDRLDAFTDSEYPPQTIRIADLLWLLAERARRELIQLDDSSKRRLTSAESARARDLGSIVHVLRRLQEHAPYLFGPRGHPRADLCLRPYLRASGAARPPRPGGLRDPGRSGAGQPLLHRQLQGQPMDRARPRRIRPDLVAPARLSTRSGEQEPAGRPRGSPRQRPEMATAELR